LTNSYHPLPVGGSQHSVVGPKLFEKLPAHDGFDPSVDWISSLALGPERRPPPFDLADTQIFCDMRDDFNARGRRDVVALDWLGVVYVNRLFRPGFKYSKAECFFWISAAPGWAIRRDLMHQSCNTKLD
jgi:hypothetical protein